MCVACKAARAGIDQRLRFLPRACVLLAAGRRAQGLKGDALQRLLAAAQLEIARLDGEAQVLAQALGGSQAAQVAASAAAAAPPAGAHPLSASFA
jgi:hypothetical protein